jgi:glycosyltransferase involved in cell wall biosynthesis
MYPLDRGLWGATTRITQLRDELDRITRLDLISGTRGRRTLALARYAVSGRLRGLDGIYVENATSLPGPADLAFLGLARALGIRVLTYIRDAQQLFGEYYRADTPKRRLSRAAFRPAVAALMGVSSRVAFPSRGLVATILGDDAADTAILLPPGARLGRPVPIDPEARGLLFVGSLRYPAHGGDLLLEAMAQARDAGSDPRLIWVAPPDEPLPADPPPWLETVRAEGSQIDALLPRVRASVTPRRRSPYNDLAVPIKVLDYLGFGRPLLVTDTHETSAIVREADCGIIVADTVEAVRDGILEIMRAPFPTIAQWGVAARAYAERNSWRLRAERILRLLTEAAPPA